MPLVKQTGVGARQNLNILCDVFLLGALLAVGWAPGCTAKIEAQVRLLNDDFTVPTRTGHGEGPSLEPTVPHYNLYKDDLKSISYETIHRILRDENEPTIYRPNDLRYFQKRSSAAEHVLAKRSLGQAAPGIRLNLNSSNLQVFPSEVLGSTRSLCDVIAINLHNNSLREFPIAALPNLTTLDLSANNFTHFEVALANARLRALNLNQNRVVNFTILAPGDGSQLEHSGLHQLQLKDNSIRRLGQLNLSLLNELEVLDLSCNQLENLETAFFPTRMKNLKHLNLARNRLQCIYRETFYNLLSMNTLILSYNEITEIDYETFLALPNLQYLDLSHNRLRGDSIRALQGIPDLVGLSIAYNPQLGSSMQEFVASWSLKELDASGTGLCKIPAALAQSVRTLKLADNWLTIISCGDLDSYPLLQYLDLSHSHIDEIEEDALGRLEILETLFLDHNNLKRIPISLPTSLENLFLQDNQIMDIQPQSFQGLNNLKTLDLSGNELLYLPDLPLPKLLTLNLQSSGISGLHQAIVKTSPHLRDLYLEDNPIKCADLLGIAEWASPCRNDRRITERINIKAHYVRMHNYFERFECVSTDPDTCATCATDKLPPGQSTGGRTNRSNCVDVNQPGTTTTKRPPEPLTQDGKNNEPPRQDSTRPAPTTSQSSLTRKTHADSKSPASPSPGDANQNELPQTLPPAPLATELLAAAETTATPPGTAASRIETNSTDKISPLPQQKQLADESASPTPSQIKSDSNYVETSPGSGPTPRPTPTSPPSPSPSPSPSSGTLLSQESTGSSHKGLKAQSDNATKTGHSKDNGEISVPTSSAKSNLPTTAVVKQQQGFTTTTTTTAPETTMAPPTTTTTTTRATTTTTTTTMITMIIGQQPRKTESPKTPGQQHNKIQELLHTMDRHLIGTPLLMHKGHVVLVPPTFGQATTTMSPRRTTTTMATTSKGGTQRLASRQDVRAGAHANSTTAITTSKGHKLEMLADDIYPRHPASGKQQGSSENAISKGPRKKTTTNGPLGQENHYQDIQQHKLPYHDKKDAQTQPKSKDNSTPATPIVKDKNQRHSNKEREHDNQFATKSAHHHSLNTPLDDPIPRVERDELLNEIDGWQSGAGKDPAKDTPPHHSRVNTPLHEGHTLNADSAPEPPAQSPGGGLSANGTISGASAALIKSETMPRTEPVQQTIHQPSAKSERWLDIRKATRHPGLVIVIGVTFATVFVVGLVQIYRYRQKPLSYITHRHYGYQNEHHQHQQYHEQDIQDHQRHHLYHHQRQPDNDRNHNQCSSTYSSGDDRYATSPHHLLRIHEHPPTGPADPPLLLPPPPPPPAASTPPTGMSSGCSDYDMSGRASSNSPATAPNYRLFQLNGRRIKHTHHSLSSPPFDDENAFYTEMNHGPQSELASDFFPMELLSAPSRMQQQQHHHHHRHQQHRHQSSSSSASIVVPPLAAHTPQPQPHAHGMTTVSLVGRQPQQPGRPAIDDDDFQDIAIARDRSKFEIW